MRESFTWAGARRLIGAIAVLLIIPVAYADDADDVAAVLASTGDLGDVVVLHLGTNGAFSGETFDEVMTYLAVVDRVIVLNAKVPRRWESTVNGAIASGGDRWPDVEIIDWNTIAGAHPEWFNDDRVHLNRTGMVAYADLLNETING